MTKKEAEQALRDGLKVQNACYSYHKFLFLNKDGLLETEDGYTHGMFQDEFWSVIQEKLPNEWHVLDEEQYLQDMKNDADVSAYESAMENPE